MNTLFPVEFKIISRQGADLLQGFTRDVGEGGLCVEFKIFEAHHEEALQSKNCQLDLTINPTFSLHPIQATASVVWVRKEIHGRSSRYCVGARYTAIDNKARKRLIAYAKRSLWAPRLSVAAGAALLVLLAGLWMHDRDLVRENHQLVARLKEKVEMRSHVARQIKDLDHRKKRLNAELAALQSQIGKQKIRLEIGRLDQGQKNLEKTYTRLQKEGKSRSAAVLKQMFQWLKSHQNHRTGLVASYEGDSILENTAFTYDQSLAAQVFLIFDDVPVAASVLSFYENRAAREAGAFFNAYEISSGSVLERTVHTGPNIWLGIAALQFENRVKDGRFVPLARKIGDWVIGQQDQEGGLRGGPTFTWYSTEHNLDAYAFFGMLHRITKDEKYLHAQARLLNWIKKYAFTVKEKRVNRGKGDATVATDTFAWAVAAIGPAKLKEMDFDPEAILDFAEKNCSIAVDFKASGNQAVRTHGFDFSKVQNVARGGVISTEWTAQMVVSYQVMQRYFAAAGNHEKESFYRHKADFYANELQKMVITSPSRTGQGRGCLPYASADNVETGHGWRTPKGAKTGSVSGTAYGLFAWKDYNPFELTQKD